ncbi:ribonuclease H-like domain-containing protein [Tanacetum coccineum]
MSRIPSYMGIYLRQFICISLQDFGILCILIMVVYDRGMFLSQRKYATKILERSHMVGCNPSRTHVDTESKLGDDVLQFCLYMNDPREPHFSALKQILRYVRGTLDHRSTSGYCVFLGNNLLSWSSKRQPMLSRLSVEAEYHGVANAVAETCCLQILLHELHTPLSFATLVYCDNVRFEFFMFPLVISSRIFSPLVYLLLYLKSFDPA